MNECGRFGAIIALILLVSGCGPDRSGITHATAKITSHGLLYISIPLDAQTWKGKVTLNQEAGRREARIINSDSSEPWPPPARGAFGIWFPFGIEANMYFGYFDESHWLDFVVWPKRDLKGSKRPLLLDCFTSPYLLGLDFPRTQHGLNLLTMLTTTYFRGGNISVSLSTDQETLIIASRWLARQVEEAGATELKVYVNTNQLGIIETTLPISIEQHDSSSSEGN